MNLVEILRRARIEWDTGPRNDARDIYDKYAAEWSRVFCQHDWRDAVHADTGSAWDTADRFEFCIKCRTSRDKQL